MPTDYLLIDMENVVPAAIAHLLSNQTVLIFTGAKQNKISRDLVMSTQKFGEQIQWIVINGIKKNAVDFHIAYYIGKQSEKDPTASFTILSKDKGYDPLIQHLNSKKIVCRRITDINSFCKQKPYTALAQKAIPSENQKPIPAPLPKKSVPKNKLDIDANATKIKAQIIKCGEKSRPKTANKFVAFVKSRLDENTAKAVIEKMQADKFIEINGTSIRYLFDAHGA